MGFSDKKLGPAKAPSQKAPEKAQERTLSSKELEAFTTKLLKERDKKLEQIRKGFDDRIKKSSHKVSQRALGAWRSMMRRQLREVAAFYDGKIKEFKRRAKTSSKSLESLGQELIAEAERKAETRRVFLIMLLESKMRGQFATTEEVAQIDKAVEGLAKFEQKHPKLEELFKKIVEKKGLKKEDYEQVIALLKPYDILQQKSANEGAYEATSAGVLVGAMSAKEREELMKHFMESERKAETPQVTDAFLTMGLISDQKALTLLKDTPYEAEIRQKVESGHFKKERQRMAAAQEQHFQKYRGIYNENIVSRVFSGKTMLGLGSMLWGMTTMALNAFVSYPKGSGPGKLKRVATWAKNVIKNPYTWAGLAATAGGAELTGTSLKTGGWVGAGPISRMLEKSEQRKEQLPVIQQASREKIEEIRRVGPAPLNAYLENGGFTTIQKLRAKIIREKKKRIITIDDLIEIETNENQKKRLQMMKLDPTASEESLNAKLTTISEAAFVLKIKNNEQFQEIFTTSDKK